MGKSVTSTAVLRLFFVGPFWNITVLKDFKYFSILIHAAKLAALRTKLGARAQYYKTSEKSILQRRRKDLLMLMFTALEENINTLKLLGKIESGMSNNR